MHRDKSPLAGTTVKVNARNPNDPGGTATLTYDVEDWWDRVTGESWEVSFAQGNMAALQYAIRQAKTGLPFDDDVLYGKIGAFGHLIHISEVVTNEQPAPVPADG
jgi:hypothetical protein